MDVSKLLSESPLVEGPTGTFPAPVDITVAIPVYNGAARLPQVLARLESQEVHQGLSWTVLAIDNNSTDATAAVVRHWQKRWNTLANRSPGGGLYYALEQRQGAAHARQRAIREATGRFVAFLDDDVWPEPNWLAAAYQFAIAHPEVGAFAGKVRGQFEVEPPPNFDRLEGFLAVRDYKDFGDRPARFDADNLRLPPAAALVVRRQAWLESVPQHQRLGGKVPGRLVQGDDYEPLLYLHKAGWGIAFCPNLVATHQIPAWRLQRSYLQELARGCGLATYALRAINTPPRHRPLLALRTIAGNLKKVLQLILRHRQRSPDDLIAAVELEFFWGCALSPLYALRFLPPARKD